MKRKPFPTGMYTIVTAKTIIGSLLLACIPMAAQAQKIPVTTSSKAARAHYEHGIELARKHADARAAEAFRNAFLLDSNFALARAQYVTYSYALKPPPANAYNEMQTAAAVPAHVMSNGEKRFVTALAAIWNGRTEESLQLQEKLVSDFPDDFAARQQLGLIYFQVKKDNDRAYDIFLEGYQRDTTNIRFLNNTGYMLKAKGKLTEAEAAFRKAVEKAPGDMNVYHSLGDFYLDTERYDEAIEYLTVAVSLDKEAGNNRKDLALAKTGKASQSLLNLAALSDSIAASNIFMSSAVLFTPEKTVVKGPAAIGHYWQAEAAKGFAGLGLKPTESKFAENALFEWGRYKKSNRRDNKTAEGSYMIVWLNTGSEWKIEGLTLN